MGGSSVTVKGAPDAGWFFPGALPTDLPDHPLWAPSNYSCFAAGQHCGLWPDVPIFGSQLQQPYYQPGCVAAQPKGLEWQCGSVHAFYPYIKRPLFVLENQHDTNQIYVQQG